MSHYWFWAAGESLVNYWGICFLLANHMLSECLLFVFWTPFVRCNMWPLTVSTFWFPGFSIRASFVWMTLSGDKTFLFWPTVFGRMSETLAVVAVLDRNWRSKFLHLIGNICRLLGRLSFEKLVPAGSFISSRNTWRTLPSFLFFKRSALFIYFI